MDGLDIPIWRSKLTFATKIRLYNTFVLPVLMYGSEAWTMTASNSAKLDACDQSCLRKICGVHWNRHVTNAEIRRRTNQLPVNKLIAKRRLSCSVILRALTRLYQSCRRSHSTEGLARAAWKATQHLEIDH